MDIKSWNKNLHQRFFANILQILCWMETSISHAFDNKYNSRNNYWHKGQKKGRYKEALNYDYGLIKF